MKIKCLAIPGKTFLAPLAGVTNLPFRRLVKEYGCSVVCSEMVSAKGLFYNSQRTRALLASHPEEKPLSIQIFGAEADSMAMAAAFIQDHGAADLLDINFGCSVKKVVRQGAGAALMKDPGRAQSILAAVRRATTLPLTIKIRTGWDPSGTQARRIAAIAQDCGVDAICVHPRTATQLFRGKADWNLIGELKSFLAIPVIGNGDINSPEDARDMIARTGCDAVMVGRAAMKNPFILSQIEQYLATGSCFSPAASDIFRAMKRLTRMITDYFGEDAGCRMLRGRLAWFVKGMPGCAAFRRRLSAIRSREQALVLIREFEMLQRRSGIL